MLSSLFEICNRYYESGIKSCIHYVIKLGLILAFRTDANGRQMVHRIKDDRFSYELTDGDLEPVSSNYYPVTSGVNFTNVLHAAFTLIGPKSAK